MFTLNCKSKLLIINEPVVMGIINVTDDSFYSKSRLGSEQDILQTAENMLAQRAAILDVGGQSSRPGSEPIPEGLEIQKVTKAIESILKRFPETIISVDTYRSNVAKYAVASGAAIVNDISAGMIDNKMIELVGSLQVPFICMHMKGTPSNMKSESHYQDLLSNVMDYFIERITLCKNSGIKDIIIDPGFGFAKTIEQNLLLLKNLSIFKILDCPILAGLSRKSTIYKTLGTSAVEALNGTTVLNTLALQNGAKILRVHDVKEAQEAITLFQAYERA